MFNDYIILCTIINDSTTVINCPLTRVNVAFFLEGSPRSYTSQSKFFTPVIDLEYHIVEEIIIHVRFPKIVDPVETCAVGTCGELT